MPTQKRQTNWFGDGGLTPEQHRLYTKNKLLDGKKNPEWIINRVPMQTVKGFNRKFGASFLSTSQSVPLQVMMNPFPAPIPHAPKLQNVSAPKIGAGRRRKKLGGFRSTRGDMSALEGPLVGQMFGNKPLPQFANRRYRLQVMPPAPTM
jgi:hypothetical protein